MSSVFWRQFTALFRKNWIVLLRHPVTSIISCYVFPVSFGTFLSIARLFTSKPQNYGLGSPIPVFNLTDVFDPSLALVWVDTTNNTAFPAPSDIISLATSSFSPQQLAAVKKLDSPDELVSTCPQNFNLLSKCFGAVVFNSFPATNPEDVQPFNYTILADGGLSHVDVVAHKSDYEVRLLPLQWAVDQAIIELTTAVRLQTPVELPYNTKTREQQSTESRVNYVRSLRSISAISLFVCFSGIAYQLPGAFSGERANLLASHLKVMGLRDSARIISWHVSLSLAYLPSWLIVAIIWHYRIFTGTNIGLVIVVHVLLGLTLASWSFFVAVPFGKSPQLAAVSSTFLAIAFAILALVLGKAGTGVAVVFSLIFPPGFYIFVLRSVVGFEVHQIPTHVIHPDPDNNLRILPILIAAIVDIFLWPYLAVLLERSLYDARNSSTHRRAWKFWLKASSDAEEYSHPIPNGIAISIRHLGKDFRTSTLKTKKGIVTAIADLSLDIPEKGIHVLLGSNGAGKSTAMSILGGLLGRTRGTVKFAGNVYRPPRGTIGIVPQKNVLFPDLTCYQTLQVWRAVKRADTSVEGEDDIAQLLKDCDLGKKLHCPASELSGGQKRKLQLAVGLVGGSKIVLVDECTSGVDPLSRRSIWRTLSAVRHERTIVFTTHFLDEADLLADTISVLAEPGKLVAHGTPVSLKSSLGEGYTVDITFAISDTQEKTPDQLSVDLLQRIKDFAPSTYLSPSSPIQFSYHLKVKDASTVQRILQAIEDEKEAYRISSYSIRGTSIEDIFLGLMYDSRTKDEVVEKEATEVAAAPSDPPRTMTLSNGRPCSALSQALTIFHKRSLIFRRSWLTLCLAVVIPVCGSCIPLFFLGDAKDTCAQTVRKNITSMPLYLPVSAIGVTEQMETGNHILASPPGIISILGNSTNGLLVDSLPDNTTFVDTVDQTFLHQPLGGVSVDPQTNSALFAWEATSPGSTGQVMLNFASNLLYNVILNGTGKARPTPSIIAANYRDFPGVIAQAGNLQALRWLAFFGTSMAAFPAFFSLYISQERRSSVQAMQFSNGLANPVGLWLGHLLFDSIFCLVIATVIVIVFAAVSGSHFHGLGLLWFVLVQYGIAGTLFAYHLSRFVSSPLVAFAIGSTYHGTIFVLYLSGYLLIFTYSSSSDANRALDIFHYGGQTTTYRNDYVRVSRQREAANTSKRVSKQDARGQLGTSGHLRLVQVASAVRASFVSVNLFSLICDSNGHASSSSSLGQFSKYGGPITYLFIYATVLFAILIWVDSGSPFPRRKPSSSTTSAQTQAGWSEDVKKEVTDVTHSSDSLRVLQIVKSYGPRNTVVDNVSFGVDKDTIFALLGPNGAGKTTTFKIISGDVVPDQGDVMINGTSVVHQLRSARLSLGVCPQFTAIDSQLTVREHLAVYGRLKGLQRGEELERNVQDLMRATSLHIYADRLASKLSGGNQRKLSLAIALIGNPSCILIDEFSTGIDAKMKRDMWKTLRNVAAGKAVVITTHSMEEASALATKVGILAKRMLAIGTTDSLIPHHTYEIHFSCRTRDDTLKAQRLMSRIPTSRLLDDVSTRFEVPITADTTLPELFSVLSSNDSEDVGEYTVEKGSLETVFMKVIRENDVLEEDVGRSGGRGFFR
ncbi:P-loop containing nucleoside triphosphate hydrolase protein [Cristinia sonorae]|uniref:P-loop containing nucleoside triphosphate hydrolase protein n=1 Tax=Cristinia sonorae TaxID=1940300 RepID=A0A8K0UHS4_9AGAR|nr:P-loop containing nucleoside triphosphate hydrolase protein [Cristinia sonorae]